MDIELSTAPSVLQKLSYSPWEPYEVDTWIKRDDLIHPFVSGNKWRKLKYNLIEARKRRLDHLLTFGGAFSNHLLAVAAAGAIFGFKTTGIVRGEDVDLANPTLFLCRQFGMELVPVSRKLYADPGDHFIQQYPEGQYYHVPEGGSNQLAIKGVAEVFSELNTLFDFVYTAAGTGATTAGLASGKPENTLIRSVAVLKGAHFLDDSVSLWLPGYTGIEWLLDRHCGGYADITPELMQFIPSFTRETGILLDPVYTGKMMLALHQDITNGLIEPGSKVLALHTGGLLGALSDRYRGYGQ